jgi:hypothetical protein
VFSLLAKAAEAVPRMRAAQRAIFVWLNIVASPSISRAMSAHWHVFREDEYEGYALALSSIDATSQT